MRTVYHIAIIICVLATLQSCRNKCGGSNSVQYNYAMEINNSADATGVIKPYNGIYYDQLRLISVTRSEAGARNCIQKDLVISIQEKVDDNSVTVYCNRDIMSKGIRVAPGANLCATKLYDSTSREVKLELDMLTVIDEPYTYYVKGSTDKGNNFIDSVVVSYVK